MTTPLLGCAALLAAMLQPPSLETVCYGEHSRQQFDLARADAQVVPIADETHGSLNRGLGDPHHGATAVVRDFPSGL